MTALPTRPDERWSDWSAGRSTAAKIPLGDCKTLSPRRTRETFEGWSTCAAAPLTASLNEAEAMSKKIKAEFEPS
jgi:hypothetical protein